MNYLCLHCRRKPGGRPRQLCWTCYYTAGVRELYPVCPRHTRKGVSLTAPKVWPEPTAALPATAGKLAVLIERAERGEHLWHPDDAIDED